MFLVVSCVSPVRLLSHPPLPLCIYVCVCLRGCSFLPSCPWAINYNDHKLYMLLQPALGCSVLFTPVYLSSVVLSSSALLDRHSRLPPAWVHQLATCQCPAYLNYPRQPKASIREMHCRWWELGRIQTMRQRESILEPFKFVYHTLKFCEARVDGQE